MKKIWVLGLIVGALALISGFLILYSYQEVPTQTVIEKTFDLKSLNK